MIFIIKNLNLNSIQSWTYLYTRSSCYLQWVTHNSDGHLWGQWGGWGGKEGEKARGRKGMIEGMVGSQLSWEINLYLIIYFL